jgi:hypothetical protein
MKSIPGHLQKTLYSISFHGPSMHRYILSPFTACPFCDMRGTSSIPKLDCVTRKYTEISIELQKHISTHLQNFALFAFLRPEDQRDELLTEKQSHGSKGPEIGDRSDSNLSFIELEYDDEEPEFHGLGSPTHRNVLDQQVRLRAATKIQRAWRKHRLEKVINESVEDNKGSKDPGKKFEVQRPETPRAMNNLTLTYPISDRDIGAGVDLGANPEIATDPFD